MKTGHIRIGLAGFFLLMTIAAHAQPLIIAHRGYSAVAPENTLASMRRAIGLTPPPAYVEIDIHRSSDGVLVVSHDSNTQRTTGVNHLIRETPFDVLRKLNAGYTEKFGDQFKNEPLPRLEEVLDAVKNTPTGVMIECKQLLVEDQVIDILRKRGELKKHVIASFSELTVYRARQLEPSVRSLFLAEEINTGTLWTSRDIQATIIGVNNKEKPENIRQAQNAGFTVWVWTVDEPAEIQKWIDAKVDGIISNQPERALSLVRK